jgi:hypothetical protein
MSNPEFVDEPPTWKDIIYRMASENKATLYGIGAIFFSFWLVNALALVVHIHWFEISLIELVETRNKMRFAEQAGIGLYINLTVYLLADLACLDGWRKSRGD